MVRTHTTRQVDDWVDLTRSLLERAWLPGWHLSVLPRLSGTFESESYPDAGDATLRVDVQLGHGGLVDTHGLGHESTSKLARHGRGNCNAF